MRRWAVILVALAACLGDEATPGDKLVGVWITTPDRDGCVVGFAFEGDQVEYDFVCPLANGSLAVEAYVGTYTEDGEFIEAMITHSSCADTEPFTDRLGFDFLAGEKLRLTTAEVVIVLERVDTSAEPSAISAVFGCFPGDGTFSPGPVTAL